MTSEVLKLKVKATRAYRMLNEAAPYTQYDDKIGLVDIIAVEDCESILKELTEIYQKQLQLDWKEVYS